MVGRARRARISSGIAADSLMRWVQISGSFSVRLGTAGTAPSSRRYARPSCSPRAVSALRVRLYLNFGAELDDVVGRDAEELGRSRGQARETGIEALAPLHHSGSGAWFDVDAPDEKGDLARIELQPRDFCPPELPRHIWRLCKAKTRVDLPKTRAEPACIDPTFPCRSGDVLGDDAAEQHRPVQHLVVLEVVQQRRGNVFGLGGEKGRGSQDADLRSVFTGGEKRGEGNCPGRERCRD